MLSRILIVLSVLYFLAAIVLGNYMGIQQDFRLKHVHVHIAVLGWLSLAVLGALYCLYPDLERGWVPRTHLWLHNVGLLIFMGGFAYFAISGQKFVAPIAIGATVLSIGVVLLVVHVIVRMSTEPRIEAARR